MKMIRIAILFVLFFSQFVFAQQDDGVSFIYAKKLMNDSLYDLAAEQFHQFAMENTLHAKAPESLVLAGKCYYQSGQYDSAIKEFTLLIARFPQAQLLDQAHFELAKSFNAAGNIRAAAKTFHQVYIFYPKSSLAKISLLKSAQKFFKIKDYEQSKRIIYDLQEAFPSAAETFEARLVLIDVFMNTKHYDRANTEINNLLALTKDGIVHAKALFRKGVIEKMTGRYQDAEQSFRELIEKYSDQRNSNDWSDVIKKASYALAEILFQKGFYDSSSEYLLKIPENQRTAKDLFLLAQNSLKKNQYDQAATFLETLAENETDSLIFVRANYLRGVCFSQLKDYYQANSAFLRVIDFCYQKNIYSHYLRSAIAKLSQNYEKNNQFEAAIKLLSDYVTQLPTNADLDEIKFHIGKIYEDNLSEFDRAMRNYDDILTNFPRSKLVDDAQFAIARCYAKKTDFEQAIKEYKRLRQNFPASPFSEKAEEAIFHIQNYVPSKANLNNSLTKVIENIVQDGNDSKTKLENIAQLYFDDLKNYEKAIEYWRELLSSEKLSDDERSKTMYFIGKSYLLLAQANSRINNEQADSAKLYFNRLLSLFPSSEWADDAAMGNIEAFKGKISKDSLTVEEFKQRLTDFLYQYPGSSFATSVNLDLAELMIKLGVNNSLDSLDVANSLLYVQTHSENVSEQTHAALLQARLFVQTHDDSAAKMLLFSLVNNRNNSELCQAISLLADLSAANNEKRWEKIFSSFIENHFYSPCVDRIKIKLGTIYLTQNHPSLALQIFSKMYSTRENEDFFHSFTDENDSLLEEIVFHLGKIYERMEKRENAIAYFQKYLRLFPAGKYVEDALFALGHLFSSREPEEMRRAINYFKRLTDDYPESGLVDSATVKIGDLFFELKDYAQASDYYLKIVQESEPHADRAYSEAQNIICRFRQGKISNKLPQIKAFKKKYGKKNPLIADLMLEAGSYFLKQKNFKRAEDIFDNVRSHFKKTSQGARAEFLLGKLNFILNKDDDALEILTKLIRKYPRQQKIVADAYIALGNFYYLKAKQVQNALFAYQKVTQLKNTTIEQEKLAKNNAIRCYTDLRMREQAVSAIYEYIDRFPDADDVFEKKILLGILFYELHEYDRALVLLKKLKYEADIENEPRIQYWIGECYLGKGEFKRAVSEYLKVAYLSRPTKLNWRVTAQFQAGVAYMKAGEPERAKKIFAKIVRQQGKQSVFGKPAQTKIDEIDQMMSNAKQRH
ncbi:MAG: tetratricopeptide repeat protein [Calditrichaeota bacterium]|nr:tetratricopeptide repeat protein [Calditrichota bacterium]